MRIRIGPGGRMFSLVLVGLLALTLVGGAASVQPASAAGANDDDEEGFMRLLLILRAFLRSVTQCKVPTPSAFNFKHIVQIDVQPLDRRNRVNTASTTGTVWIAICSDDANGQPPQATGEFNAPNQVIVICGPPGPFASSPKCRNRNVPSTIPPGLQPSTPTAGRFGTEHSLHSCPFAVDINGDGIRDLVCRFFISKMNLNTTSPSPTISLLGCCDTPEFEGTNAINCGPEGCPPSSPQPNCFFDEESGRLFCGGD